MGIDDHFSRLKKEVALTAETFKNTHPAFSPDSLKGAGHTGRAIVHSRVLANLLAGFGLISTKSVRKGKQAFETVAITPVEVVEILAERLQLPQEILGVPVP